MADVLINSSSFARYRSARGADLWDFFEILFLVSENIIISFTGIALHNLGIALRDKGCSNQTRKGKPSIMPTMLPTLTKDNAATMPAPYVHANLAAHSAPVIVKEKTSDRKLGECSATHASQHSCPKSCPWFNAGCYAEQGPQGIWSRKLNANAVTDPQAIAEAEAQGIRALTGKRRLRLHIVGDATTNEAARILASASAEHTAKHGKEVWTYTHGDTDREAWGDISVLRSVETVEGAQAAHDKGFAVAMVVPEFADTKPYDLGNGFTGVPCLHQTGSTPDCNTCGLCTKDTLLHAKKRVILFAAHGSKKKSMGKRTALPVVN